MSSSKKLSLEYPKGSRLFLLNQLVHLRLFADLKKSFLGWTWLILLPLFAILTWIFMKGAGVLQPGDLKIPYPAFVILSTTIWTSFFDSYKGCSQIFQTYGKILLVNKLPIDIIICAEIIVVAFRFLIPFIFILIYFLSSGISIHPLGILFPLLLFVLLLCGTTIGLFTGLFNAISKDFSFLVDNIMRLLMLLTPVVYGPDISEGMLRNIIKYNPLTYLISSAREILLYGQLYEPRITIICGVLVIISFIFLTRFFILNTARILERGDL